MLECVIIGVVGTECVVMEKKCCTYLPTYRLAFSLCSIYMVWLIICSYLCSLETRYVQGFH